MIKAYKGGKLTIKELGTYFLETSSDIAAYKSTTSEGANFTSIMSGWGEKIDTGLKVLSVIGIGQP